MALRLRDYQDRCATVTVEALKTHKRALIVKPTGTGKTITFCEIMRRLRAGGGGRGMVLAHREELITQAAEKIRQAGLSCEIEKAERWAATAGHSMFAKTDAIVSSIQTQNAGMSGKGRMTRFDPFEFGIQVVDEAHHATAPSYRSVMEYYQRNKKLLTLGCTATPDRKDEEALGKVFDVVPFVYEISDAVSDGWLVNIRQSSIIVEGLDFSSVRTTAGDLNGGDLERVMMYEKPLHGVVTPVYQIAGERKVLVFAASVAHAERMTEIFNRHEHGCARVVTGTTPHDERRQLFRDYRQGLFRILVNVGVATEGFDEPGIEVVAIARPTKSRALYAQMIGRGTRPLPNLVDLENGTPEIRRAAIEGSAKPYLEVIDLVGVAGRHKLKSVADILGGNYEEAVVERAKKIAKDNSTRKGEAVEVDVALKVAAKEIQEELERQRRRKITARARFRKKDVDPFDVLDVTPNRQRAWDKGRKPTENQLAFLRKVGVHVPDDATFAKASQLIGKLIERSKMNLATYKQTKILRSYGYDGEYTFTQASAIIDRIAKNGWKRPEGGLRVGV